MIGWMGEWVAGRGRGAVCACIILYGPAWSFMVLLSLEKILYEDEDILDNTPKQKNITD